MLFVIVKIPEIEAKNAERVCKIKNIDLCNQFFALNLLFRVFDKDDIFLSPMAKPLIF